MILVVLVGMGKQLFSLLPSLLSLNLLLFLFLTVFFGFLTPNEFIESKFLSGWRHALSLTSLNASVALILDWVLLSDPLCLSESLIFLSRFILAENKFFESHPFFKWLFLCLRVVLSLSLSHWLGLSLHHDRLFSGSIGSRLRSALLSYLRWSSFFNHDLPWSFSNLLRSLILLRYLLLRYRLSLSYNDSLSFLCRLLNLLSWRLLGRISTARLALTQIHSRILSWCWVSSSLRWFHIGYCRGWLSHLHLLAALQRLSLLLNDFISCLFYIHLLGIWSLLIYLLLLIGWHPPLLHLRSDTSQILIWFSGLAVGSIGVHSLVSRLVILLLGCELLSLELVLGSIFCH